MTTIRRSIPTTREPLTIEQRIAKAAKKADLAALAADEAQADADTATVLATDASADAAAAQLDVDGALAGTTAFTGLNVGGVNVKPFLDKTDGSALTNASGLGAAVVETAAIDTTAIRPNPPYAIVGASSVNGLSAVGGDVNAAAATVVLYTTFTLAATEGVTIALQASGAFSNAETTEFGLFVDYAGVQSMQAIRNLEGPTPAQYRKLAEPNASGGPASLFMTVVLTLAAGTHTIQLLAMGENPGEFVVPAGGASVEVYVR